MQPSDYQKNAARTLIDEPGFEISGHDLMVIWCAIGLAGEAGEIDEIIKKGIFHQHGINLEHIEKELGDVLWYLAGLCTLLGLDLSVVMEKNIEKLRRRYPNGFTPEASRNREEYGNSPDDFTEGILF